MSTNGDDYADLDEVVLILRYRLFKALKDELATETDESLALRKALLMVIAVMADDADEPTRCYIDWLLHEFKPLASKFTAGHTHEFIGDDWITCVREDDRDHLTLVVAPELLDKISDDLRG